VRQTSRGESLTAVGLSRLLAALHRDGDAAAGEYERLRRTLVRFFDWRGAWPPDECADETIDRVARRLGEGTPIDDVWSYAVGVARLVLLERRRMPVTAPIEAAGTLVDPARPPDPADVGLHDCLESCLAALDTDSRVLVLEYYQGERGTKIDNRQRLASALGITSNALRSRVQRIRERLEACVHECATRKEPAR
jgi:DNA-directed RNA polymerase specialized sigma24 family protein